jgi:phage tail-like protein
MGDVTTDPAVSICFSVRIDGQDLGAFTACDGLGCEVTVEQREEGGNNGYVHQLPGRLRYTNVRLTRPINADSEKIARWFAGMASGVQRTTAEICAMTADGTRVATWSLVGVIPVRWQGPSLSVDALRVATETLELAHHGFVQPGQNP